MIGRFQTGKRPAAENEPTPAAKQGTLLVSVLRQLYGWSRWLIHASNAPSRNTDGSISAAKDPLNVSVRPKPVTGKYWKLPFAANDEKQDPAVRNACTPPALSFPGLAR
jgi:hypothetical protein